MATGQRRYSDQEKAEALAFLDANRGNYKATSRQIGIPAMTLKGWDRGRGAGQEVTSLLPQKKVDLADRCEEVARMLLDSMPEKLSEAYLKDTAMSFGIVVDKMRLLREQPTVIEDNGRTDLTDDERVARIAALLDAGAAERARQSALPETTITYTAEPTEPA